MSLAQGSLRGQRTVRFVAAAVSAVALGSCGGGGGGDDLFRLAARPEGGALLSAWLDANAAAPTGYLAGGYVGVDLASLGARAAGRLVEYTRGRFRTVCTASQPLWWVHGARFGGAASPTVYAAGEGGTVVRYRDGRCEALTIDGTYPSGRPTLWGALAVAENEVWFVGGSGWPDGPRGVLLRYDGTSFRQETALPPEAQRENLYKIARDSEGGLFVVGTAGLVLHRAPGASDWQRVTIDARPTDNRLFTVACAESGGRCVAVGGAGSGMLLEGSGASWRAVEQRGGLVVEDLPGLNGVLVTPSGDTFVVGNNGVSFALRGEAAYRPRTALTSNVLHGVGGDARVQLAVGGELGNWTAAQRGVVLVRGDDSASFDFDGVAMSPEGSERRVWP